jgi:hypothetical protein
MIINGKDLDLGQSSSGLPDVSQGVIEFMQPAEVGIIGKTQVNGKTQEVVKDYIKTRGVRIQTPNNLVYTKTGERIWNSQDVYFLRDIILKADDIFIFNKTQYRIVVVSEWPEYGYNQYHVRQDYTKIYVEKPVKI